MAAVRGQTERVRPGPEWIILLVFVVLWGLLLFQAEQVPMARVLLLDELWYLDRAADTNPGPHFMTPLYPALLRLAGLDEPVPSSLVQDPGYLRPLRILQIFCWLGTLVLLRLTAGRALAARPVPGRVGAALVWLPSLLFACYAPAAVYALTLLVEMPLTFLVTLFFYLLTFGRTQVRSLLLAGLVLGCAALLRASVLVLLPLPMWLGWSVVGGPRRLAGLLLLLTGAVMLPLAVPSVQNSRQVGHLVGPTLNGGLNFHIGNGPHANGFYVAPTSLDWREDPAGLGILRDEYGLEVADLAAADQAWWRLGFSSVGRDPLRFLGLWLKKMWLHLQAWQIDQLTPLSGWRHQVPLLRLLFVPWFLLVVLGLVGAGAWRDRGPRVWLTGLFLLMSVQSLFFVVGRYRLVLAPLLCLLAAAGVGRVWTWWSRRHEAGQILPWTVPLALVLGLLVSVPWGLTATRARWEPLVKASEGRRWAILGEYRGSAADLARAEVLYREAVAAEPDSPEPWLGLAAVLVARGNRTGARSVLAASGRVMPRRLETQKMLLALMLADGHRSDALELARRILADHPHDADTLHNASVLLAGFGNSEAATAMARRLVAAHPSAPQGAIDLGILLARAGKTGAAAAVFRAGLRRNPGHEVLLRNLELVSRSR